MLPCKPGTTAIDTDTGVARHTHHHSGLCAGPEVFCVTGRDQVYLRDPATLDALDKVLGTEFSYRGEGMTSYKAVCDRYPFQHGIYAQRFKYGCDHYDTKGGFDGCANHCNTQDSNTDSALRAACRAGCTFRECTHKSWIEKGCNQQNPQWLARNNMWHTPDAKGGPVAGSGRLALQFAAYTRDTDRDGTLTGNEDVCSGPIAKLNARTSSRCPSLQPPFPRLPRPHWPPPPLLQTRAPTFATSTPAAVPCQSTRVRFLAANVEGTRAGSAARRSGGRSAGTGW